MPSTSKKKNLGAPRPKRTNFYVINVKIRPIDNTNDLSPKQYAEVFRQFYLEFIPGKSSKQKECLMSTQGTKNIDGEDIFFGTLVQTTDINNKRWFNKRKKAIDEEFRIPAEYGANASVTEYIFIPSIHRYIYKTTVKDYIDPYAVRRYFLHAMPLALKDQYVIHVDVETSRLPLQKILDAVFIKKLDIKINYSNNDFTSGLQKFVDDDLKSGNVDNVHIIAKHKKENSINLQSSNILKGALESSISNGEAEASIVNSNGRTEIVRTKAYPEKVNIEIQNEDTKYSDVYKTMKDKFPNDHTPQ